MEYGISNGPGTPQHSHQTNCKMDKELASERGWTKSWEVMIWIVGRLDQGVVEGDRFMGVA